MKIISKNKDFYDYMLSYGVDETEVFVRETLNTEKKIEKGESENTIRSLLSVAALRHEENDTKISDDKKTNYRVGLSLLYFCGEMVPLIWLEHWSVQHYLSISEFSTKKESFYTRKAFIEKCNELNISDIDTVIGVRRNIRNSIIKRFENSKKSLNEKRSLNIFTRWSHELKAPYYEIKVNSYKKLNSRDEKYLFDVIVNPMLLDFQFSKYKDGAQTFQSIEQYLFGELKIGQKEMIEISDKDKAHAKGHGGKYSFKNTPTKKRE